MNNFLIRPAGPEDLPDMDRIALSAKAAWGYPAELLESWRAELQTCAASLRGCPAFVAVGRDGRRLAMMQIDPSTQPCDLRSLFVDPACMGQGIGRALLEQAAWQAHALGHRQLQIDADPNAAEFYLACGARPIGQVPAPIPGEPGRVRPQLILDLVGPTSSTSRPFVA